MLPSCVTSACRDSMNASPDAAFCATAANGSNEPNPTSTKSTNRFMQTLGVKGISPTTYRTRRPQAVVWLALAIWMAASTGSAQTSLKFFELTTRRMDVDCDGAPTAYGPPGKRTL